MKNLVHSFAAVTFLLGGIAVAQSPVTFPSTAPVQADSEMVGTLNKASYVDGVKYAATAAGIQQAIADAETTGSREVHLPCGATNISTTLTITNNGGYKLIGCGAGGIDSSSVPATSLIWTGTAGHDLLQITGQATNRMDKVVLENLILDGGGTARFALRMEKLDTAALLNVRIRNAVNANWYNVDVTAVKCYNCGFTVIAGYGVILDWATVTFSFFGCQFDGLVATEAHPFLLIQEAGNTYDFEGCEANTSNNSSFTGFIRLAGIDTTTNPLTSSFNTGANYAAQSVDLDGEGAPQNVKLDSFQFYYGAGATSAASQGADVVINGTTTNPVDGVMILNPSFFGNGVGGIAVAVDNAKNVTWIGGSSAGHTAGSACTLSETTNGIGVRSLFVNSADTNATCGAGSGAIISLTQDTNGSLQSPAYTTNLLRQIASNSDLAGTIAISSGTSASHSFATTHSVAPSCTIVPLSDPGIGVRWWVTSSTTAVTAHLSAAVVITFNYLCIGNPN